MVYTLPFRNCRGDACVARATEDSQHRDGTPRDGASEVRDPPTEMKPKRLAFDGMRIRIKRGILKSRPARRRCGKGRLSCKPVRRGPRETGQFPAFPLPITRSASTDGAFTRYAHQVAAFRSPASMGEDRGDALQTVRQGKTVSDSLAVYAEHLPC